LKKWTLLAASVVCSSMMAFSGGCARSVVEASRAEAARSILPDDASQPAGEPMLERPTLRSLGAWWIIKGDNNKNAKVTLEYRKAGTRRWKQGADLLRVQKGANDKGAPSQRQEETSLPIPSGYWLFAGSALMLDANTAYELKLTLRDPDGGKAQTILSQRTIAEPIAPNDLKVMHVIPGDGGGTGTEADPFQGLKAADAAAQPGTLFLVGAGTYPPFVVTRSGEKGKPIVYRGAGDAIIQGEGEKTERAIDVVDMHDVWFEKLAVRKAANGIVGHDSTRLVIRRCTISECEYGINAVRNLKDQLQDFWISDNTITGPSTWPRTKGIENARGIQVTGAGHVVCYNYIKGFGDGIDTYQGPRCEAIDFHNNEIELCTDDGCEMDYSERNTRCFENRFTNVFQGISTQPVFGGPVYIFRNAVYNIQVEPFKIHNSPSGVLIYHNTLVKNGVPMVVMTTATMDNFIIRNNLFIGAPGRYACQMDLGKIIQTDMDYDGYGGGPWNIFLKWSRVDFKTMADVRHNGPAERHAILVTADKAFASRAKIPADLKVEQKIQDLRIAPASEAVDAGVVMPGLNDGFKGRAPDLGAYELGQDLPHYGPRPEGGRY